MKVYSVLRHVPYEGEELLGVFGSKEEALAFAREQDLEHDELGVLESELGQPVDFWASVEWVE